MNTMSPVHRRPWRGVNLGNWLLLERWMQPELFAGTDAHDEYALCAALGATAERIMRQHRDTYITGDDFAWMRQRGINAVRIPFGYWLLNPEPPFITQPEALDRAIALCQEYGLAAILDLHGLPGFQSVEHHTGRRNHFRWREPEMYRRSLDFVEQVAERYRDSTAVEAISVVNEPSGTLPASFLLEFYQQAHDRIRRHMSAERVAVIIAAFTEARLPELHRKIAGHVLTDIHPYPCFCDWRADQLMDYVAWGPSKHAPHLQRTGAEDLIVGEWSLGVAKSLMPALAELPAWRRDLVMRTFAHGQLCSFEQTAGWFFWSYKVAANNPQMNPMWGFRAAVERGWLPDRYA